MQRVPKIQQDPTVQWEICASKVDRSAQADCPKMGLDLSFMLCGLGPSFMDLGLPSWAHSSAPLNGPRKSPLDFVNFWGPIFWMFRAENSNPSCIRIPTPFRIPVRVTKEFKLGKFPNTIRKVKTWTFPKNLISAHIHIYTSFRDSNMETKLK